MLLIIHNLPVQMRYSDVRDFLISKSGIQQLILDNLIHEKSGSKQQVTVGLVDESDAAIFVRKINNLYLDGEPIYIENVGQKMELEQPYRPPQYHTQSRKDVESTVEQYSLLKPNRTDFGNKHALMISTLPPVGNIPSYNSYFLQPDGHAVFQPNSLWFSSTQENRDDKSLYVNGSCLSQEQAVAEYREKYPASEDRLFIEFVAEQEGFSKKIAYNINTPKDAQISHPHPFTAKRKISNVKKLQDESCVTPYEVKNENHSYILNFIAKKLANDMIKNIKAKTLSNYPYNNITQVSLKKAVRNRLDDIYLNRTCYSNKQALRDYRNKFPTSDDESFVKGYVEQKEFFKLRRKAKRERAYHKLLEGREIIKNAQNTPFDEKNLPDEDEVECNPPQDYLGMEAIEAFLKQRCGITAKITAREKIWMVCCESFDVFDKLCNVGKVFIGKVRVSFEPFKLSIHKNRPRYAEMQFLMSSSPEKDIVVPKYNNDDYFDDCKDFIIPTTEDNQNAKEAKLTEDDCNEIICDEKTVDGSHGVHKENVAVTPTNNDDAVVLDNPYENNPISDIICNIETVNRSPEKIELIEPNQDLVINEDDLEEF
ncbi:unnamed protein product [Leptidea sinapis]|uniref:RRM domain-containing protein n=1 Tax=Leptidea sinapis TaxID=189913 RepID=A0A5E4Q5X8_9NEOP|nr:unnamed protein product [Leptidea sinapis]